MKKRMMLLTLILGVSLLSSACTKTPTNEGEPLNQHINSTGAEKNENQNKLNVLRPAAYSNVEGLNLEPGSYISIIGRYSDDSYWKEVEEGANRAVEDINSALGYKGDDKIKLSYSAPDVRDDVDEQINILDEELARYPIAICIAAIDTTACEVQFDLAAENSIPIVTFDSGSDYQHIAAHIATDNIEAAETAATQLGTLMEGTGEVAVFIQDSFSMTAKNREHGFLNKIATDFPGISVVNVYHYDQLELIAKQIADEKNAGLEEDAEPIDPDSITQEDIVRYVLEKYPNLKGIYAANLDMTQLVANVLTSVEKEDLFFVGFDGGEEQIELLENDVVNGLIFQNPYGMGYATVVAAARNALNLGNEAVIDSGYIWVTKELMADPQVSKMLY